MGAVPVPTADRSKFYLALGSQCLGGDLVVCPVRVAARTRGLRTLKPCHPWRMKKLLLLLPALAFVSGFLPLASNAYIKSKEGPLSQLL